MLNQKKRNVTQKRGVSAKNNEDTTTILSIYVALRHSALAFNEISSNIYWKYENILPFTL